MPRISAIEPQKKTRKRISDQEEIRFNIFNDGKFAFAASAENVLKNQLKIGTTRSSDKIEIISKSEEQSKLFDSTLRFLSYRQRSRYEIEQYLAKKITQKDNIKYSEAKESSLIEKIIQKLTKYKYINDLEFSKWWVKSRLRTKPKGARLIKSELIQKGIDNNIIDSLLDKIQNQSNLATLALEKKIKKWDKLNSQDFKKKCYTYLTYNGFDYDAIREAVAEIQKKR